MSRNAVYRSSSQDSPSKAARRDPINRHHVVSLALWCVLLVVTGAFFRTRESDDLTLDWVVIAQLLVAGFAVLWGGIFLFKVKNLRFGGKLLILYVAVVGVSALNSSAPRSVFGYWILLAGAAMLSIILANHRAEQWLRRVEFVWLTTVSLLLAQRFFMASIQEIPEWREGDVFRLGVGDGSNGMGMTAALLFWMSFWLSAEKSRLTRLSVAWIFRSAYVAVIVMTRSRVAMVAFLVGGAISCAVRLAQIKGRRAWPVLALMLCSILAVLVFGSIALQLQVPGVDELLLFFNRGQNEADVGSLTGRTEIWPYAFERIFDSPLTILFGHGYGISRLVLMENSRLTFKPTHAHNGIIESVLSTGIIGGMLHLLMLGYSVTWLLKWAPAQGIPPALNLRAVAVISALLTSLMTETFLVGKLDPMTLIFLFYVASRDAALPVSSGLVSQK